MPRATLWTRILGGLTLQSAFCGHDSYADWNCSIRSYRTSTTTRWYSHRLFLDFDPRVESNLRLPEKGVPVVENATYRTGALRGGEFILPRAESAQMVFGSESPELNHLSQPLFVVKSVRSGRQQRRYQPRPGFLVLSIERQFGKHPTTTSS
jgi:hypothetical protein